MPHRDTLIAIKQAFTLALNSTQGHKRSYQTSNISISNDWGRSSALNVTQGHVSVAIKQVIYQSQNKGTSQYSKCHTGTQA